MEKREHQSPLVRRRALLCGGAILVTIATITIPVVRYACKQTNAPPDDAYLEKLKTAHHFKSSNPAQRQTVDLFHKVGLRSAALNAIGEEPREVRGMASGEPVHVFAILSHLGGLGEIIWVDQWTNFPIKLPPTTHPGEIVVPRHAAVRAAVNAVEASGGCFIRAGKSRTLVARTSEKEKYEAAIRALGWLDGTPACRSRRTTHAPAARVHS